MSSRFVTAKLKGENDCRQGAVVSETPLIIRGQSGMEYMWEGKVTPVINPPEICIGCNLPLGRLCSKCESQLKALDMIMREKDLAFETIDIRSN